MKFRIAFIIAFFCSSLLVPQVYGDAVTPKRSPSFLDLVGQTDWQISLKDFSVSTVKDGKVFALRAQDDCYFSFIAHPENGGEASRFGPLQPAYAPTLSKLLNFARCFGAMGTTEFSMNIDWELYPESIRKWAMVWKDSELREKWKNMTPREGYPQLVDMITRQLEEDFQPLVHNLGFKVAGSSMEKMAFQEVDRLPYFHALLKPAGVPPDLELPMPLILSLRLKAAENTAISPPENAVGVSVDRLFATAKSSSATLYCSFLRELGEYEISGDRINRDGTFARLLPLSRKEFRPMAAQLLKACLQASGGDKTASMALRLDPVLYPKLYREAVRKFTFTPESAQKIPAPRPQLPELEFYVFAPSPASGFAAAVTPFLTANGYEFRHLLVSIESHRKAISYPSYTDSLKPLGIHPEDRPAVPNIVYLIAEKRPE